MESRPQDCRLHLKKGAHGCHLLQLWGGLEAWASRCPSEGVYTCWMSSCKTWPVSRPWMQLLGHCLWAAPWQQEEWLGDVEAELSSHPCGHQQFTFCGRQSEWHFSLAATLEEIVGGPGSNPALNLSLSLLGSFPLPFPWISRGNISQQPCQLQTSTNTSLHFGNGIFCLHLELLPVPQAKSKVT